MIETSWVYLQETLGPFGVFLAAYMTMAGLYGLGGLLFYFVDKYRVLDAYKIQPGKYATDAEYIHCMKNLLFNYLIFILPIGVVTFPLTRFLGMSSSLPLPSISTWAFHVFLCLVGEDFFHYWIHRYLHTPWAYKFIHKEHHHYLAPFGLSATFSHPVEIMMEGVATFLPVLLLRPHFFTFYSWFIIRQLDAVYTHCGYELPVLNLVEKIPFYGGVTFHDYHHKAFTCNYASRFTYLDVMFKTFRDVKGE